MYAEQLKYNIKNIYDENSQKAILRRNIKRCFSEYIYKEKLKYHEVNL